MKHDDRETLLDHLVAAVLSALAMLITAAVTPVLVIAKAHIGGRQFYQIYHGFYIWGATLVVIAFACGLVAGPKRMASIFGHLWGTEDPPDHRISWSLWGGVIAIVLISWWLVDHAL